MIPKEIVQYLETPEGKEFFNSLIDSNSRQSTYSQRKSFLDPPKYVKRWFGIYKALQVKTLFKSINVKETVDREEKKF